MATVTTETTADGGIVKLFFPPASELNAPIQTNIPCPQSGCNRIFKQPAALRFHMEKVHKIIKESSGQNAVKPEAGVTYQFFCPETDCPYHYSKMSDRRNFFPCKKNLRMHYMRCHMEKQFKCTKDGCTKAFSVELDRRIHEVECGQTFTCLACDSVYDTSKAYLTHCRRKGHPVRSDLQNPRKILAQAASVSMPPAFPNNNQPVQKSSPKPSQPQPVSIIPRPDIMILSVDYVSPPTSTDSTSPTAEEGAKPGGIMIPKQVIYVADARTTEQKQSQPLSLVSDVLVNHEGNDATEACGPSDSASKVPNATVFKEHKCTRCGNLHLCDKQLPRKHTRALGTPKSSASTQTSHNKRKRIGAQTQTTGDFILRRAMQCADIPIQKESRGSQVSPRAKLKHSSSSANLQTSQTQTVASPRPVKKRRRKKLVQVQDIATTTLLQSTEELEVTSAGVCNSVVEVGVSEPSSSSADGLKDGYTLTIPDNPWMSVTDTQTQTIALLDELQAGLGESHSTQTLHSYLLDGKDSSEENSSDLLANEEKTSQNYGVPLLDNKSERTVDQGVFCDLRLDTDLTADTNTRSMACSPIFNVTSGDTMDIGTDPLFDPFLLNEPSASFSMSAQNDPNCVETCDANIGTQTGLEDVNFPELLTSGVQTSDLDGMCMNIETQTMENDSGNMIDQLLTNMQTQTSDDFLVDFSFCDIETQTPMTMSTNFDTSQSTTGNSLMTPVRYVRQEIQTQTSLYSLSQQQGAAPSTDTQTQTLFDSGPDITPNLADSFTQTAFQELENLMDDLTK